MFRTWVFGTISMLVISGCHENILSRYRSEPKAPSPPSGAIQSDFYKRFCDAAKNEVEADSGFQACGEYIYKPDDVAGLPLPGLSLQPHDRTTLVFIPGFLGQCVADFASPFSDQYERLRASGYNVVVVPIEGRSSAERNGEIIDRFLSSQQWDGRDAVVIGYSKGATDFVVGASAHPDAEWLRHTRAFVSLAGVIGGYSTGRSLWRSLRTSLEENSVSRLPTGRWRSSPKLESARENGMVEVAFFTACSSLLFGCCGLYIVVYQPIPESFLRHVGE